jgi:hypothetical protein
MKVSKRECITVLLPQLTAGAMYHSYSSYPNPRVLQQVTSTQPNPALPCLTSQLHVRRATRLHLQHTQNIEPSADLQARYQTENMYSGAPAMFGMYVAADFTLGAPGTAALGGAIGTQGPSHPTTPHLTSPIRPPESPMPDMDPRPPTMIYAGSSNVWQQRPMPHKITRAPILGDYCVGAKGTGDPMAPVASGDTGDSQIQIVTMHWLRADGIWAQAQVLVTDQIHNSQVHFSPGTVSD